MSSDNLVTVIQNIAHDPKKLKDLFKLVDRYLEIMASIDSYKDDLNDIDINAKALGFKTATFKKLVKYIQTPDILDGDRAELEALDVLMAHKNGTL